MANSVELFPVADDVIIKHERVLMKQVMAEAELLRGPLEELPKKSVDVPDYTGADKTKNELCLAYRMVVTDPLGEKKVSPTGELQDGRQYLCDTFKTKDSPNRLVLVSHLMSALQYEGSQDTFLATYDQLLPITASTELKDLLVEQGFVGKVEGELKYVSARSAFVQFGAALIASGTRVFDDYWEVVAKKQNLTPHDRVFKLSRRLSDALRKLKPQLFSQPSQRIEHSSTISDRVFEPPYLTVTEQPSAEIRLHYGREFANGEHASAVVPGQNITGSLELSALFKIPKYHSKNSFQQATQMKALDSPIGIQLQTNGTDATAAGEFQSPGTPQPAIKPSKRMLNSILDAGSLGKAKKAEEQEEQYGQHTSASVDEDLHISGWKFDLLPLKTSDDSVSQRSSRGLPLYEKDRLIQRLNKLTPNQIREVEHSHDSLYLNLGLQNVRKIRSKKWLKYWQYKTGVPIGLMSTELDYFREQYLKEVLEQSSSVTNYNPETNVDETHVTVRRPKVNYVGYSNIRGFKPPYVSKP
ncbi:hypothetical protein HG536_0B07020 [Torulaspora globosa]|uniref:Uncharacterized protein n=1 Tax=Torulaspora globosa TaxID=48254 RepID=A0A7G3ZE98_9SACH|nr:uncharacterized protein HG536_0B07020 [Torulaspora globosa]QLL31834.1 hypothetical protein HG536_0B07020 [Torulaspora globosa]